MPSPVTAPKNDDPQPGALYSRVYLRSATAQRDSPRFRKRIYSWFTETIGSASSEWPRVLKLIRLELGTDVPYNGRYLWGSYFETADIRDVLDTLTLIYRVLANRPDVLEAYRSFVTRVFDEESL